MMKYILFILVLVNLCGCFLMHKVGDGPCKYDRTAYSRGVVFINRYSTDLNICVTYDNKSECIGYMEADNVFMMTINKCSYETIPCDKKISVHFFEGDSCHLFSHKIEPEDVDITFMIDGYGIYPVEKGRTYDYFFGDNMGLPFSGNPIIKADCKIYAGETKLRAFPDHKVIMSSYVTTSQSPDHVFRYYIEDTGFIK